MTYPPPPQHSVHGVFPGAYPPGPARPAASLSRRWFARLIDWVFLVLPAVLVWNLTIWRRHVDEIDRVEEQTGVGFFDVILRGTATGAGGTEAELIALREDVLLACAVLVGVMVFAMAMYDFFFHVGQGGTPGKIMLGLRAVPIVPDRHCVQRLARMFARSVFTVVLPGAAWVLFVVALLNENIGLGVLGIALLGCSVLECAVTATDPRGPRCLHDRMTGTVVVRKRGQVSGMG